MKWGRDALVALHSNTAEAPGHKNSAASIACFSRHPVRLRRRGMLKQSSSERIACRVTSSRVLTARREDANTLPDDTVSIAGRAARNFTSRRRARRLYLAHVKDAIVLRALLWEVSILR